MHPPYHKNKNIMETVALEEMTINEITDIALKDITVLSEKANVEMNLKNQAYYFILSKGLLSDFGRFCNDFTPENTSEKKV